MLHRYLFLLFCFTLISLALLTAFNAVVDPFRMLDNPHSPAFHLQKEAVHTRVRLLKAYEIRRLRPDSILLGSSRCHLGFRPSNKSWSSLANKPYNAAFDGATTKEMYYYLLHAYAIKPLKLVLVGLDTYHPTGAPGFTRPDFSARVMARPSLGVLNKPKLLLEDLRIMSSWDALLHSCQVLVSDRIKEKQWLAADGQRLGEVFFRRKGESFQKNGPRYYFDEIDRQEVGYKLEWKIPKPEPKKVYPPREARKDSVSSLGYIEKIILFCREKGIPLVLFFTPSHAHQLEISLAAGEWPSIEKAKRDLVALLQRDAQADRDTRPFLLYDFSTYSSVTMESVPPLGSKQEMQFYWDSSHFKENVGDMVLGRILGDAAPEKSVPGDFGAIISLRNIEAHLEAIRNQHGAYAKSWPRDVSWIQGLIHQYKQDHGISD